MRIEVTYDLVCPWCHIGLANALAESNRHDVEIQLVPYQLAPDVPEGGVDHHEFFARRVGSERAASIYETMEALAGSEGLSIHYDRVRLLPNTRLAHGVVLLAHQRRRGTDVARALMTAHFEKGLDIGSKSTLSEIAGAHGIEPHDLIDYWRGTAIVSALEQARQRAMRLRIRGVPHYVVDGQEHPGAISKEEWTALLTVERMPQADPSDDVVSEQIAGNRRRAARPGL
jgi:predicted DsbA family dithiol-disulfide isomerase